MNFDVYYAPNGKVHLLPFNKLSAAVSIALFGRA